MAEILQKIISALDVLTPNISLPRYSLQDYYAMASGHYDEGVYDKAVDMLNKAIEINNELYQLYYLKGLSLLKLGQSEAALESFQASLRLNPEDVDTLYNLARLHYHSEEEEVASAYIEQARELASEPGDPDVEYLCGLILELQERNEEAIAAYECSLKLDSEQRLVYVLMARLLSKMKNYPKAIESFKAALERDPNDVEISYELALCLAKVGNWGESIDYCQKVIDIDPNYAKAYNQMGLAYYCTEDLDRAIEKYQRALEIDPNYASALNNLAYTYEKKKDYEQAITTFERYLTFADDEEKKVIEEQIDLLKRKAVE